MTIQIFLNLGIAITICAFLYYLQKQESSFSVRVFTALALGIIVGGAFHAFYGVDSAVITSTNAYLDIIGGGYVKLLQMIVMPLILVSIIGAILKLKGAHSVGKVSAITISTLMLTTMVAAAVGILIAKLFGLSAVGLTATAAEAARGQYLQGSLDAAKAVTFPSMVLSFIPSNPFLDMTGVRKTSTIAVVIFAIFVGLAGISLVEKKPQLFNSFENFVTVAQALVMRIVSNIANFSASFGSTMGQNGCAGLYPAMLAVMIAPTVGIDPFNFSFIAQLIAIVTIGSIGVAGVGGGATFAALIVLSAMNLPVALAGLLISIEPIIDMGRTALNVSGSIVAGTVTSRALGQTDLSIYNNAIDAELDVIDTTLVSYHTPVPKVIPL